ncbi:MAG TPA: FHA domain-containing protein [Pyrinomonadaceae bacterium]|nr:FHA domain-containing protein [Pyrinomonadaceae bacterium]
MATRNKYVIVRDDLLTDPVTMFTEGLLIGRLRDCEVLLNHPSVSRVQAGIKQIDDDYYLFPLRSGNPVLLNGRLVTENEALAPGDVLRVGPFKLEVDDTEEALVLRVSLLIGTVPSEVDVSSPGLSTDNLFVPPGGKKPAQPRAAPVAGTKALDIFWDKRIREAGKMVRPSPLFPRSKRRSGKAQFNWLSTTDLTSRWPISFFVWSVLVVAVLAVVAAYSYTKAYTPGPLSKSHATNAMSLTPPIAVRANAGACTGCHSWQGHVEEKCAACHNTEAFVATVITPHEAAGISCVDCHSEHHGNDYSAREAALVSCAGCHNDANQKTYSGKRVSTPHGGTFGYPVVNGVWSQKAVNEEEWDLRNMLVKRLPTDSDAKWRTKQFHAFHNERVKLLPGMPGSSEGNLSCSSCHKSFDPPDRETPRTRCGSCHNGLTAAETNRVLIAAEKPNCTSCHMQHIKDKRRWGTPMLSIE